MLKWATQRENEYEDEEDSIPMESDDSIFITARIKLFMEPPVQEFVNWIKEDDDDDEEDDDEDGDEEG